MAIYMVERVFAQPLSEADFAAGGKALAPCLEARDVKWVASHFSTDGTRSMCLFEATDAEAVREANRTAGLPFERVWATHVYRG
jgi:hypothetical protein